MMKAILAAVSGVLVVAATGAAGAATGDKSGDGAGFGFWGRGGHEGGRGGHGTMMLKRLDTNHDGTISLE